MAGEGLASVQGSTASSVDVGPEVTSKARSDEATNVRVAARFRPPVTDQETEDQPVFLLRAGDNSHAIDRGVAENATVESQDGRWSFEFDTAFSEEASQQVVYDRIGGPAVKDVLAGYNGTILMYGQTGSGKTFTLFGNFTEPDLRGLAPRAAEELVQCLQGDGQATIQCSFLEIYRERMRDLLQPSNQSLRIKEHPQRGLVVDGLTQGDISSTGDIFKALDTGNAWRSVAATRQNQYSSRSHAIFTLFVTRRLADREHTGKLSLVDLAGSERVSRSHSTGETLEEAKKINSSLTALGKVIDALVERRTHVPYRDSTLTRVLEEALGGNSRTTLLVAASACSQYLEETVCSLRFAARAQKVSNYAHVNFVYSAEELWPLVAQLQKDLAQARRELQSNSKSQLLGMRRRCRGSSTCSEDPKEEMLIRISVPKLERDTCTLSTGLSRHSTLSVDSPRSGSSPSAPSDLRLPEEEEPIEVPQASTLAASAAEALRGLEEALISQEEALEQAQLLRPEARPSRQSSTGPSPSAPSPSRRTEGSEESDTKDKITFLKDDMAFPQRWRALRQAVEARALRWRLLRERYKSESLSQELELRNRYTSDLERRLEAVQAELTLLKSSGPGSPSRKKSVSQSVSKPMSRTPSHSASAKGETGDQIRALREAQCALRGENLELKQELAKRERQIAALAADLAARDMRLSSLRHEARVKDAMLGCLQKEIWQPAEQCDEELEQLLSAVANPLLMALRHPIAPHAANGATAQMANAATAHLTAGHGFSGAFSSGTATPCHFASMPVLPGTPAMSGFR